VPVVIGQAQPAGQRLLSMDFKDAEIVNLLRILAAESGRNIVAGDDVKGKVSVSLRNVTWEQALDTILEIRGLQKVERAGVIRIVSVEQLAKEREALIRVEEARTKAEIETRTKAAEAQLKEQELIARRLTNELNEQETRARGPLREETIRLSYADPEEIAKTLQGILGIPPEGTAAVPTGAVPVPSVPSEPPTVPSGGTLNPALGRVPQAASPLLGTPGQSGQPVMSVSQDVLAKGITIRAHKATNSVFIRHYEADLARIKKLIKEQLDVPLPQVKIEARMEILDRNSLEALGVQWGSTGVGRLPGTQATLVGTGFQSAQGSIPGQVIPSVGGVLLPDGSTVRLANTPVSGFVPSNPGLALTLPVDALTGLATGGNLVNLPFAALPNAITQGGSPAGGFSFGVISNRFNINLALEALATQGKTRTLARPEIVTVENSKAAMSLGEEIPYATVSSAGTQVQFKEAVLKLEVLPTVIRERVGNDDVTRVKMVVLVENNSRGATISPAAGVSVPIINRRKAETQVLVKEGERLVIGGVSQSSQQDTVRKVPVLGDIPVLGRMFKQNETFDTGRELVIFVTPSVIRHQGGPQAASR
jgi:type IV pilus assembly protein PilQ